LDALNGGFGSGAVGHLDEAEATGLTRVTISNDIDLVHNTIRFEELAEVLSRSIERNIAYINIRKRSQGVKFTSH
jgi:hypothetical protein